jgi:hypothetical protein
MLGTKTVNFISVQGSRNHKRLIDPGLTVVSSVECRPCLINGFGYKKLAMGLKHLATIAIAGVSMQLVPTLPSEGQASQTPELQLTHMHQKVKRLTSLNKQCVRSDEKQSLAVLE